MNQDQDKKHFIKSVSISGGFLILLWLIKILESLLNLNIIQFAIYPRNVRGLTGILVSPLIHADINHLTANSLPVFLLALGILYFYKNASLKILLIIYIITDIAVWLFGRPAFHIGASGLIYGYGAFLFFSGLIRRDPRSIALALLVIFLYGGMVWGILPLDKKISWESHLYGALTGIVCAFIFRKSDPYKRYEWEEESDLQDPDEPG